MKQFNLFFSLILLMSALGLVVQAQTIPTTLSELYGKNGFTIETKTSSERLVVGSWVQGANMPFPRYYGGSVMYSRNDTLWLYVIGGDTSGAGHATSACLRYNVNTDTWEYIAPLPVPTRVNAAAILGDKIYTMGGFSTTFPSPALNSFFEYDINTNTWTQLPNIPQTIFFHGAVGFEDSLIYIFGGIEYTPSRSEVWLNKVWLYNIINQNFRSATDMPKATASFGYTLHANVTKNIYVVGGLKSYTELWSSTNKGEINQTNRAQIGWTVQASYPLGVYSHYGAAFSNDELYFCGGSNTTGFTPIDNVYGYNINTNTYSMEQSLPLKLQAFYAGVNIRHTRGFDIVRFTISGGVTDVREAQGVAISGQTWVFTDTIQTSGLNEISNDIPNSFKLLQNYPNPFNPSTTIKFSIPEQSFVKLEIFNSLGEKVSILVSETLSAGTYEYEWDAENLTSGIYLYRMQTNNYSESRKMILIK